MAAHKIPAATGSFSVIPLLSVLYVQYEQRNALVMLYIFVTGLMLCTVAAPEPGLPNSALNEIPQTDDDRLNQALLLVDILKSEYLKLLRERSGAATDTEVEHSTCAATGGPTDLTVLTEKQNNGMPGSGPNTVPEIPRGQPHNPALAYTSGPHYPWGWPSPGTTILSRRFYDAMPQPAPPLYPNPFPYQRRVMHRNHPDYSYYYGPYRRNDYYDENRQEAITGNPTSTVSAETASAPPPKATGKASQLVARSNRRFNIPFRRSNYQNPRKSSDTKASKIVAVNENNKTGTSSKATATAESVTENATSPIPGDASSISTTPSGITAVTSSASPSYKKKKSHAGKIKVPSTSTTAEKWPAFLFKSTMRIFLERSTPLPIPLPENNAFCFTNPTNALCRSF